MSEKYYITSAIPYVNAKPHLGHILEWYQADTIARYQRLLGKEVAFTCGTDENSLKNVQAAEKAQIEPQAWLDQYAKIFEDTFAFFDISLTHFRRGSDQKNHWPGVQKLWQLCDKNGDIYKKKYQGLYCVGCEAFYTQSDLIDGKCPEHLTEPEKIEEENYFFTLSKYQDQIKKIIEEDTLLIVSEQFKQEMLGFINQGLEDFSISRSVERARGVGVPVPNDDSQVMYVWFDALNIYMTAIGFGTDDQQWQKFWPADVHVIGKGINRFHAVYWIGMLLSAGIELPKAISVHGYLTVNDQKMSKSLGNVIDPIELVEKFGHEPIRYYLLKFIPSHADGDFSEDKFKEIYTADLANGIGNLCSRVATLCAKNGSDFIFNTPEFDSTYHNNLSNFEIQTAITQVIQTVSEADQYLSETTPWKKEGSEQQEILQEALNKIAWVTKHLEPFMPKTANTISQHFSKSKIEKFAPLFPRLQ